MAIEQSYARFERYLLDLLERIVNAINNGKPANSRLSRLRLCINV